jgi:XTP/dITP diphosphohydrolase
MKKIVLASKNRGKIAELGRLLATKTLNIKILGLTDFPYMPDVIESGKTLSQNAWLKAKQISEFSGLPALADDSGLFIDVLNGDPGIYSSRWAEYSGVDTKTRDHLNIEKVLAQMANTPIGKRGAQFRSVVAFYNPTETAQGYEQEQEGELAGEISFSPAGDNGFGYDPIFVPHGFNKTLAQLDGGQKDQISHRGKALRAILPYLIEHL